MQLVRRGRGAATGAAMRRGLLLAALRIDPAEAVLRGARSDAQRSSFEGLGQSIAFGFTSAEQALAAREQSVEAEVAQQRQALIQQQRALEGLLEQPQVALGADVPDKRLESWMSMQKEAMLQEESAIKGLAEQQAKIAMKEGSLERSIEDLVSDKRAPVVEPAPTMAGGFPLPPPSTESLSSMIISAAVHILFTMIYSYIYGVCFTYAYPPMRSAPREPRRDHFTFELFHGCNCDPDWRICCCSFFCSGIRWADTMGSDKVRFLSFWPAVLLFALLQFLTGLTGVAGFALLALGVLGRQRIREVYDLPHGDCSTCWQDCLVWLCCGPCAIMQEASQIEFVELPSVQAQDILKGSPMEGAFPPTTGAMPDTMIIR
mmetsp:Transcript_4328/g.12477  ORF Transcript_4328/g.12477 Transcript_4328/m.12477 type:complete len:375 (-) Transcript_4328:160-1284(-)